MFTVGNDIVVFPEADQMVVRVTDPALVPIVRHLPYVQIMEAEDQVLASLPWCEDSCKIFNNIGINTTGAAPFWQASLPLIEGKYKPMAHQLFTAAFITLNPRSYVLSDPRTGKTGALILGIDYLQKQRHIQGACLIITTVTTMHGVWYDGIKTTLPNAEVKIVHGKKRKETLKRPAEFYITNYDSCRLSEKDFAEAIKEGRIGSIVIDELTHVGNYTSGRHESIYTLANGLGLSYVIGVTGSPGGNAEAVFGMCRMINQDRLPTTSKNYWMDLVTYRVHPESPMRRMSPTGPGVIHTTMQPAVRFNKADIIDLPPVTTQDRTCDMSTEQSRMRDEFKKQAVALAQSGEVITAVNGGVLCQKLLQVAEGFCNDNNGNPVYLDYKDRLKTIAEAVAETSRKVVIFCPHKAAITRLAKDLRVVGYSVGVVDGSITGQTRARILGSFQNERDPHVLVCHPTTVSFGVELSAADTMIFAGVPLLGGFIYAQALERLSSTKQTASKITIIRIIGSPEEQKFFKSLDNGKKVNDYVSMLFEEYKRGLL